MSTKQGRVAGKVALITGGAGGMGLASAKRLVEEGAITYLSDINAGIGEPAAASIGARFIQQDVISESGW